MTEIFFRFASEDDLDDLFRWRNDPITRKCSFNTTKVTIEEHKKWFQASLENSKRNIFIVIDQNNNKIGHVRYDREGDTAELGVTVAPEARSKGFGTKILTESAEFYFNNFDVNTLIAKIKNENMASIKVFEKSGYTLHKKHDSYVELRKEK